MPEPNPVRCAVIGTKNIAGQHLPVLQALPEAEVAALCDIDAEAVSATSREFGVAQTFTSLDDLQAWGEFDAVYVLVSVMAVADVAEHFIRAGDADVPGEAAGVVFGRHRAAGAGGAGDGDDGDGGVQPPVLYMPAGGAGGAAGHGGRGVGDGARGRIRGRQVERFQVSAGSGHALGLRKQHSRAGPAAVPGRRRGQRDAGWCDSGRLPKPDSFSALLEYESGAVGRAIADHFGPKGTGHWYEARTASAVLTSGDALTTGDRLASCTLERRGHEPIRFGSDGAGPAAEAGVSGGVAGLSAGGADGSACVVSGTDT